MKPIKFDGANVVFGAEQPEYEPMPARLTDDGVVISCWELTPEELEQVKKTGQIWLSMLTFFQPLQPVSMAVEKPFEDEKSNG